MMILSATVAGVRAQSLGAITKIPEQVYRRAAQAVVKITVGDRVRQGVGIIIGKTRNGASIVLTSNALISGFEKQLSVQLENQAEAVPAQLIKEQWRNSDLALLAARASLTGAPALQYGQSSQITVGDNVAVLGFPGTPFLSQNSGNVLRFTPEQIILSFSIKPEQEGGPVIDRHGRVLGVAFARGESNGVAIPVEVVQTTVDDWLRNAPLAENWRAGKDTKKWYAWVLGVLLITAAGVGIGVSGVL